MTETMGQKKKMDATTGSRKGIASAVALLVSDNAP